MVVQVIRKLLSSFSGLTRDQKVERCWSSLTQDFSLIEMDLDSSTKIWKLEITKSILRNTLAHSTYLISQPGFILLEIWKSLMMTMKIWNESSFQKK